MRQKRNNAVYIRSARPQALCPHPTKPRDRLASADGPGRPESLYPAGSWSKAQWGSFVKRLWRSGDIEAYGMPAHADLVEAGLNDKDAGRREKARARLSEAKKKMYAGKLVPRPRPEPKGPEKKE